MNTNPESLSDVDPFVERLNNSERYLHLNQLHQHYIRVNELEKGQKLIDLLEELDFNQVVVFVAELPDRAVRLTQLLQEYNIPTVCIHSLQSQEERIEQFQRFRKFDYRILISTRAVGVGMDIEAVDVVIIYDLPDDAHEYMMRVGKAGAFGCRGLVLSLLSGNADEKLLADVQVRFHSPVTEWANQGINPWVNNSTSDLK